MKKFLNDNLNEVLIASAEYIGENIETLDKTVWARTQAIQQENELLRSEIIEKLAAITMSSNIKDVDVLQNFKNDIENTLSQLLQKINEIKVPSGQIPAEFPDIKNLAAAIENVDNHFNAQSDIIKKSAAYIGKKINSLTEALNNKLGTVTRTSAEINWQELRDILQQTLPEEIVREILSQDTIQNLDSALKRFIKVIEEAANYHRTTMANVAGTVQNVLTQGTQDLQNQINETNNALKSITTYAMEQINSNYAENLQSIFQAMADNLASIKRQLALANEAPMIDVPNNPAANAPETISSEELNHLWHDYQAYFRDDERAKRIMRIITGKDRSNDYTNQDVQLLRERLDQLRAGQNIEYNLNVA